MSLPSAASALGLPWLTFPLLTRPLPRALTWPQGQGDLLRRHLNDVGAGSTGALAAERQAPQDLGAAGRALKLAPTAVSGQVCLQVTPGGDRAQAAKVLGAATKEEGRERSGCLSRAPRGVDPGASGAST